MVVLFLELFLLDISSMEKEFSDILSYFNFILLKHCILLGKK